MNRARIASLNLLAVGLLVPLFAHAALTATPLTWNVIGLDSNNRPGAKVLPGGRTRLQHRRRPGINVNCSGLGQRHVNLRAGSLNSLAFPTLAAGGCVDAYFEVEVAQNPAAYDTTRRYHITPRKARTTVNADAARDVRRAPDLAESQFDHRRQARRRADPAGGTIGLVVGNTYTIELDGGTATQGYNQFETFINFSNTIFQVLSVTTSYSANNSAYVGGPAPNANDKLYADACQWDNDPASPNYRSCIRRRLQNGRHKNQDNLCRQDHRRRRHVADVSALLYDFSGSSYHYNADFSAGSWIANIIDPQRRHLKAFRPNPTSVNGISTLTIR